MERDIQLHLRRFGLAGLAGALFMVLSDWMMLGSWLSAAEFQQRWLEILTTAPMWRVWLGGIVGPIGAGLYALGWGHVYLALRPGDRRLAAICFGSLTLNFICIAGAFHASFPLLREMLLLHQAAGLPDDVAPMQNAMWYFGSLYMLGMPFGAVGILILPFAILKTNTLYPHWFAAVNPLLIWMLFWLFAFLPAPIGGPLWIGSSNLVFVCFFAASTAVLWNRQSPAVANSA